MDNKRVVKIHPNSLANLKPHTAEWLREHKIHLNHPQSEESKKQISESRIGKATNEGNPKWRGDRVGYFALHAWISRKLGKPSMCEHCGDTEKTRYEWANISKEYKRDFSDWIRLCKSCHFKFDKVGEKVWLKRRQLGI